MKDQVSVLVIEDDAEDLELLKAKLRRDTNFNLVWAKNLSDGIAELSSNTLDLVLLDLTLPDSTGLKGITRIGASSPLPIVVLTGIEDEQMALNAVKHGAQDYLIKGQCDHALLTRTLRYAMERQRLLIELQETRKVVEVERELRRFEGATPTVKAPATALMFGQKRLKTADPDKFSGFVEHYEQLIEVALDQRAFKVKHDLTGQLNLLAEELGSYSAVPRDAVDIHTTAVNQKATNVLPGKAEIVSEEARYLLVELMGHLCSYYRRHCSSLGVSQQTSAILSQGERATERNETRACTS